jgi:hypothetical protein
MFWKCTVKTKVLMVVDLFAGLAAMSTVLRDTQRGADDGGRADTGVRQ